MRSGTISWGISGQGRKSRCSMRLWRYFIGCWGGGCWEMTVQIGGIFCTIIRRSGASWSSFSTRSRWGSSSAKCSRRRNLCQWRKSPRRKRVRRGKRTTRAGRTPQINKLPKPHPPNNPNSPSNNSPRNKPSNKAAQRSSPTSHRPSFP